jgi:polar amino acid transport system substrate-binding protein
MKINRRLLLKGLASLPLVAALPATAEEMGLEAIRKKGRLRVAVYNDFPPYSMANGKGIDADIGRALAAKLGMTAEVIGFNADEDMNDDLRNMVWKGHYLGTQPADVMMHVPVDEHLAKANPQVRMFAPYHRESLAMARNPDLVPLPSGSAAVTLEVFTREKIGVEIMTLADSFLLGVMNGRIKENVVHFKTVEEAGKALREGKIAAILAPRSELEAALSNPGKLVIDAVKFGELKVDSWPLGMACKVEEREFAEAMVSAMAELKRDGTLAAIFKTYGITHNPA